MVEYAIADREGWGASTSSAPAIRDLWGELAKHYGHKSSYIPDADHGSHSGELADEYAEITFLADRFTERLRQWYGFKDDAEVADYLEKHHSLSNLLVEAQAEIREYFGSDVQLVLKVVKDPDVGDDQRLFVLIQTDMSPEDALDRLDELYDAWWLDALPEADHKMSIDVEYL